MGELAASVMEAIHPAIECSNITKTFGSRTALRNFNLKVDPGKIVALVGPNGAGKTTLLKTLATLVVPTGGNAFVCGRDVIKSPLEVKKRIGFVPSEERSFFWRLTGFQNLRFFAALHGLKGEERKKRINYALEAVGLEDKRHGRFREYSSGMKQALGIARGILHNPPVLLMDEPTRSLSPDVAGKTRQVLLNKAKKEGTTILISSHDLMEVEELADEIAILHRGALRVLGSLAQLKEKSGLAHSSDLKALFEHFTHNG